MMMAHINEPSPECTNHWLIVVADAAAAVLQCDAIANTHGEDWNDKFTACVSIVWQI